MSESILGNLGKKVEKFSDNQGTPASEHAKKLAKDQSKKEKAGKPSKTVYTLKGNKILQVTVKANGAYSTYLGTIKPVKEGSITQQRKAQFELQKKHWVADGSWIEPHQYEEKIEEIVLEMQAKEEKRKK